MKVLMNQVLYTVLHLSSSVARCGKHTTTFTLRNAVTDIAVIAEGTQEQVFERLGITVEK